MPLFQMKKTAKIIGYEFPISPIEDDPTLEQIWPAGAEMDPGFIEEHKAEITSPSSTLWGWEEKYDGERLLLHFKDGYVRATTRRQSSKTGLMNEQTNKVPHLRGLYQKEHQGTIIDGEIILLGGSTLTDTASIMRSNPERAIELQRGSGWVTFKAFDCLFYKGKDIRNLKFYERRVHLAMVLNDIYQAVPSASMFVQLSEIHSGVGYEQAFERITKAGGEGCVLKRTDSTYGEKHSWLKVKKEEFLDAFVTGWEKGQGRNSDVAGFLYFSVYDEDGNVKEIARVGGLSDDIRRDVTENYLAWEGRVAELKAQQVTNHMRLRHPRINRWRDDKDQKECKFSQLETLQKSEE